jgi:hypothetical protein
VAVRTVRARRRRGCGVVTIKPSWAEDDGRYFMGRYGPQ